MLTVKELKELRESKQRELDQLLDLVKREAPEGQNFRNFSNDENTNFNALTEEIEGFDAQITQAERMETAHKQSLAAKTAARKAPAVIDSLGETKDSVLGKVSLARMINILNPENSQRLDGAEEAAHAIAKEEAREFGGNISGIGIPHELFMGKRAHYVAGTANVGGNLIKEEYSALLDSLVPNTMLEAMGGKITPHNDKIVRVKSDSYSTAGWAAEEAAVAEKNVTLTKTTYTPEKLGAVAYISKDLKVQEGYGGEDFIRKDLQRAISLALETAWINGAGASNVPAGLLAKSGINTVAIGTNGGAITWVKAVELESALNGANSFAPNRKMYTTPQVVGAMKTIVKDSVSGMYIMDHNGANGYPVHFSTLVPSTLTKGTSSGVCHAAILGDFSGIDLAQFGPADLVINPYTYAKQGYIEIVLNSWWNVVIDYPESFSVIVDITV